MVSRREFLITTVQFWMKRLFFKTPKKQLTGVYKEIVSSKIRYCWLFDFSEFSMSRTTCDREDSLGLTQSPRLDTRASSVTSSLTYACSTLDKGNRTVLEWKIGSSILFQTSTIENETTDVRHLPCQRKSRDQSLEVSFTVMEMQMAMETLRRRTMSLQSSLKTWPDRSEALPKAHRLQILPRCTSSTLSSGNLVWSTQRIPRSSLAFPPHLQWAMEALNQHRRYRWTVPSTTMSRSGFVVSWEQPI